VRLRAKEGGGGRAALWLALAAAWVAGAPAGAASEETAAVPADVAAETQVQTSGFLFKEIPVDAASARSGAGQSVQMRGRAVTLAGQEIRVGDRLRPAALRDRSRQAVDVAETRGRIRIISVVPAVQTPTCEQQTHYLSEKSGDLPDGIDLVTISLDTPEVQRQFADEAAIENVTFLSDAGDAAFGRAHGLLIEQPHLLTRAVLVVDADDVVRYLQVVPEVSHMPDMEAAFEAARRLAVAND